MFKLFSEHFDDRWLYDESRSFLTTVLAFLAVDGAMQLTALYSGNFGKETWIALGLALSRSILKTILTMAFPRNFPKRSS